VLESPDSSGQEGNKMAAVKKLPHRFSGYPLKAVYNEAEEDILIVTVYPLKKKHWR